MALPEGLLSDVKNYLSITWNDESTEKKLTGIIERGMKYLNSVAGEELDYSTEDKPKELLMDYCRYVRSNALEEYQLNFLHELMSLQIQKEVKRYETEINNTGI